MRCSLNAGTNATCFEAICADRLRRTTTKKATKLTHQKVKIILAEVCILQSGKMQLRQLRRAPSYYFQGSSKGKARFRRLSRQIIIFNTQMILLSSLIHKLPDISHFLSIHSHLLSPGFLAVQGHQWITTRDISLRYAYFF